MFHQKPDLERMKREEDVLGLINSLEERDEDFRRDVIKALAGIGEPAIEPLIAAVKFNDRPLRYHASEALGEINGSIVVIIRGGLIKFVNSTVTKLLGYSTQEVLNRQFPKFVAPEYEDMVLDRYKKRLMDEEVPSVYRVKLVTKKGDKILVEIDASRIEHEGRTADLAILTRV